MTHPMSWRIDTLINTVVEWFLEAVESTHIVRDPHLLSGSAGTSCRRGNVIMMCSYFKHNIWVNYNPKKEIIFRITQSEM